MINKSLFTLVSLFMVVGVIRSQNQKTKQLPSVAVGIGVLSFNGDVGNGLDLSSLNRIRSGYMLKVEQRLGKCLGVSLNGMYGKLANSDNGPSRNLNFQSQILQGDLDLVFHLDNDFILKRKSVFAPYLLAGIGYLNFDPYGDLKDRNGITYNYWTDGSIRNIAQNDVNAPNAVIVQRDYTYETRLKDSAVNYKRSTLTVPLGVGFQMKLNDDLAVNLAATYYITFTDWIDNVTAKKNDGYLYTHFSIQYNFGGHHTNSNPAYKNIDFSLIDKTDSDEDGVADINDRCAGTPKDVRVDSFGCPQDNDGDGVPDYSDKELMTKKGEPVDENGITQTDKPIPDQQVQNNDTIQTTVKHVPIEFRFADINNDGIITTNEIGSAIDSFFEGNSDFTIQKINALIDFFFEQ